MIKSESIGQSHKFFHIATRLAGGSVLALMLFACGQGQTTTQPKVIEATLTINTVTERFTQGNSVDLKIEVSSPTETIVNVGLSAPPEVHLEQTQIQVSLAAGEKKAVTISAKLLEPGFFTITIGGAAQGRYEQMSDQLGFNVEEAANNRTTPIATRAAALDSSGQESLEDHIKNLPIVTDQSIHVEQIKADLENRRNVRNDYILKNASFTKLDGSSTEPRDMVIGYLRGTGSGKPLPGELEGINPKNATPTGKVQPRSWCGSHTATVHFDIKDGSFGTPYELRNITFPLKGYRVHVFDDNSILGSPQIAEGDLDTNGTFSYQQPNCDVWSPFWGDYSPPDIFYILEARIPNSPTASFNDAMRIVNTLGNQYSIQTGTAWEDTASIHSFSLDANAVWQNNFLWLAKMFQFGQDFNAAAGGTKIGFAAFWPASVVSSSTGAAPVARFLMGSATWETPYPAVHEFGHNVRFSVSNPTWYAGCLGNTLPCDPGFAEPILNYNHAYNTLTTPAKALNEGFADYFYEMTRDYYSRSGTNYVSDIWTPYMNSCSVDISSCSTAFPQGAGSEARISSFLYQYTTKLIAPYNGMGNTAAFGVVRDSIKDTGTFNQGFYDVWNSYFKKSYTSLNSGYLNPCTTGTVVNKTYAVSCLLTKMTLTEQAVILP